MCGIFGYVGPREDAAKIVLSGLKRLEYRGYDSWGVAAVRQQIADNRQQGEIIVKKKAGKIGQATVSDLPSSSFALGHTRWATHGGVTDINAHPHLDCTGKIAIIHNGIIENYEGIKAKLLKLGHKFVSETDSEVFAHLVEQYCQKLGLAGAVRKAFNEITGLNAIVVIRNQEEGFVAVRNGSPLVIGLGKNENFLASDPAALLSHTKKVIFLDDGQMAEVTDKKVQISVVRSGRKVKHTTQTLEWSIAQTDKGRFPYFMLKEIWQQPEILSEIALNSSKQTKGLAELIKHSFGSYLVACGSAAYVCLAGTYLFSKIAKRHVNFTVGSEFGYYLDFLTPRSLVMALSQSGETMDTLESVKKAKEKGAKIFALVNVLGSTLYRLADEKMLIGAGPEKSVASTKAVTGKLAHLTMLAYALAGSAEEGQKVVQAAAKSVAGLLSKKSVARIKTLVRKLKNTDHIYVIGRGLSYPASLETAMKIKEISYIHAEGMAAGELKHGPLALVTKGTFCIAYLPSDETFGANLAGAMEMKARGGYIIGVAEKPHEVFDYFIPVKDAAEATIIPNVVFGQLLAYFLAVARGLDPDMPRNLAKSVTVK